jgi:ribonuclease III
MGHLGMALDGALVAHLYPAVTKSPRAAARQTLEARLGYAFKNEDLLDLALTHASAAEGGDVRLGSYQRLEFLGDRVLGLAIAEMLFTEFKDTPEGELSQRLSELVSADSCAEMAVAMDLGAAVKLGPGEARSGGRKRKSMLADVCESVIAAVYLDGGFDEAKALVGRFWRDRLINPRRPLRDGKTALQEWAAARGLGTPTYRQIERAGPDHSPVFRIEVAVPGFEPAVAEARAKRTAEKAAAIAFLTREGVWMGGVGGE